MRRWAAKSRNNSTMNFCRKWEKITRQTKIFPTRLHLLSFEEACTLESDFVEACENNNYERAVDCGKVAEEYFTTTLNLPDYKPCVQELRKLHIQRINMFRYWHNRWWLHLCKIQRRIDYLIDTFSHRIQQPIPKLGILHFSQLF